MLIVFGAWTEMRREMGWRRFYCVKIAKVSVLLLTLKPGQKKFKHARSSIILQYKQNCKSQYMKIKNRWKNNKQG